MTHTCPTCSRVCKTESGLTAHMNAIHLEMSPTQWAKWETEQVKSLANRTPLRVALESMVGKESE